MNASALIHGVVTHHRRRPVAHALRYRIFMVLLDLDELPALRRRLRLMRARIVGFDERDHGDGGDALRPWIDRQLAAAGLDPGGRVRVLCMPRVLGMVFNPLTLYFCHAPDGALRAMLYEVNNTFGQRHTYLLPVHGDGISIRQDCPKRFHVSPFLGMDLHYRMRIVDTASRVGVFMTVDDASGPVLAAGFTGVRHELTDAALGRAVFSLPLLALKVLGGIHWEATKLWLKGLRFKPAPRPPAAAVTIGT
ncbi:MAG TPA: DUF1365 domain-containing protein [Acetobacteraceae bacterium]|nr:DUF1365 domain-containing protein [Acetobacteraceae bacterium]